MKKIELTFGDRTFTAKFGVVFLGKYLKSTSQSIQEMLTEFQSNPFYEGPNLMYASFKHFDPTLELSFDELADLLDENGGVQSPQLIAFIQAFTDSITVDIPAETLGKSKKPKLKN